MVGHQIPSGNLKSIRSIFEHMPQLEKLTGGAVQFRVIVDANIIIRELLWLVGKRKNPNATTQLQEVVAADTIILHAPVYLEAEVMKYLPVLAEEKGLCQNKWLFP